MSQSTCNNGYTMDPVLVRMSTWGNRTPMDSDVTGDRTVRGEGQHNQSDNAMLVYRLLHTLCPLTLVECILKVHLDKGAALEGRLCE